MNKRKSFILIASVGVIGAVVLILLATQLLGPTFSSAATLTEQEARETVLQRYSGEINGIELHEGTYIVDLQLATGPYEIKIHAENGDVLSIVHKASNGASEGKTELSQEQLESIVLNHAPGTIASIDKVTDGANGEIADIGVNEAIGKTNYYRVVLRSDQQETVVTVDLFSGEILTSSTTMIDTGQGEEESKANNVPANDPPKSGSSSDQPSSDQPSKDQHSNDQPSNEAPSSEAPSSGHQPPLLLTESEAARIALQHIPGELDDVDLEQSGGVAYYLVEIERDDDMEATVQIHAITGEIMSVTWDD